MAEKAVSFVLEKLSGPLFQEATLQLGLSDQVVWLIREMRWMESFLEVADAKRRNGDKLVKNWVREVREVAQLAEDIIDTFMLEIEPRRRRQRRIGGLMGHIIRYAIFPFEVIPRHKVGAGINGLRAKIEQINASRETYGLLNLGETTTGDASRSAADEALQARRRISPYLDGDDNNTAIVGLDVHVNWIMKHLLDAKSRQRYVISIVGTGGLGKTTLAKKVYNSKEIKTHFKTWAWVSVSQDYRVGKIVKSIAKQVMGTAVNDELERMEVDDIKVKLLTFLKEIPYFIVLDDVWSSDVWEQLRSVLPDVKNGSRVLLTTRSMDVAESAGPFIQIYKLPVLNHKQSWKLFLKKAFPENQDVAEPLSCPEELEDVGDELVKRCRGLPLALTVLGGILSKKDPIPAAWKRVADRLGWDSTKDGEDCLKILGLSYDELPHHHLRSCFLYLAVFPEDWMIWADRLIYLWIAEGFIPRTETRSVEETARTYLQELARRSMIQVISTIWDGGVGEFRIHDLFRDLCIREAREDGFLNVYSTNSDRDSMMIKHDHTLHRCLALHNLSTTTTTEVVKDRCLLPSNLRSLLAFRTEINSSEILNGLELLRVIHLESLEGGLASFPDEMMKSMIHLRYLSLRNCLSIKELPSSIGNLCNLEILYAAGTGIRRIPKSLGRIQTLRHLYLPKDCECTPDIGNLTNLETLFSPNARGGWIEQRCLEKLINIQKLGVNALMATQCQVFLHSILKLKRLSFLTLYNAELILTEFLTGLSTHNHLLWLILNGPIAQRQLPNSRCGFPPNLTFLALKGSNLEQDPMATLEKLPNLVFFSLYKGSYLGKEMACTAGGFPKLKYLKFESLEGLEDWRVEGGAMPKLSKLSIRKCSSLMMLPEGLQHLTSLKRIFVYDSREEFRGMLRPDGGEDWYKIRHVPYITVTTITI